jgi:hypothetical protein
MNASGLLRLEDCQFLANSQAISIDEKDPSETVSDYAAAIIVFEDSSSHHCAVM